MTRPPRPRSLQLRHQPRLADAGLAEDREQLGRAPLGDARERRAQDLPLALAAEQGLIEAAGDRRSVGVEAAQQQRAAVESGGAGARGARPARSTRRAGSRRSPRCARAARRRPPPRRSPAGRPRPGPRPCRRRSTRRTAPRRAAPRRHAARAARRPRARPGCRARPRRRRCAAPRRCRRARSKTARPVAVEAVDHRAQRLGVEPGSPGSASCETTQVTKRRASGAGARSAGGAAAPARPAAGSRPRARAGPGEGSMPRPSTSGAVRVAVGGKRVRLAAGAVERQHQLPAQPLAQRVVRTSASSSPTSAASTPVARSASMRSLRQVRRRSSSRPISGCGEALPRDVREHRPAPQRQRLAEGRRGLPGLAARELLAAAAVGRPRSDGRRAPRAPQR